MSLEADVLIDAENMDPSDSGTEEIINDKESPAVDSSPEPEDEESEGKPIALIPNVRCTTPRGRYDVKLFPDGLRLQSKTNNFEISKEIVTSVFLLSYKSKKMEYIVMELSEPVMNGKTKMNFIVVEVTETDKIEVVSGDERSESRETVSADGDGEKLRKSRRLASSTSSKMLEPISRLFRDVWKKDVIVSSFVGPASNAEVECMFKVDHGLLYPLNHGFLYIHKPTMFLRFEEIDDLQFQRCGPATKTFDVGIKMKDGKTLEFCSIDKKESDNLRDFIQKSKLNTDRAVKSGEDEEGTSADAEDDYDSDGDDSYEGDSDRSEPGDEYDSEIENSSDESGSDADSDSGEESEDGDETEDVDEAEETVDGDEDAEEAEVSDASEEPTTSTPSPKSKKTQKVSPVKKEKKSSKEPARKRANESKTEEKTEDEPTKKKKKMTDFFKKV